MEIKPVNFVIMSILFCTVLKGAAIAKPLDESEQEVENQLQVAIQMARREGYQPVVPRNVGRLNRGAEAPKTVLLSPNRDYSFVAVCDRNCDEIQLSVKDTNGKAIASNPNNDAVAVLNFKPSSEDRYQIAVKMEKCSAQYCIFGLGIFSKR